MSMKGTRRRAGFTLVELVLTVAIVVFLFFFTLQSTVNRPREKAQRIKCFNNLKNIGLAVRIFAIDHSDRYPGQQLLSNSVDLASVTAWDCLGILSNQLSTTKILICPSDSRAAEPPPEGAPKNISYFASLTASEPSPTTFLSGDRNLQVDGNDVPPGLLELTSNTQLTWSKAMHNKQGNIAMADGSVHQFSSSRLRQALADSEVQTNLIVLP